MGTLASAELKGAVNFQAIDVGGRVSGTGVGDSILVLDAARRALQAHRERVLDSPFPPAALSQIPQNYAPHQLEGMAIRATESRTQLISTLDSLAMLSPGDDQIHGHRVGYRFLQGELEEALAVARDCQASTWWCAALAGFTLHQMGDFDEAETAFDRMVAGMPLAKKCTWSDDLSIILSGDLSDDLLAIPCLERVRFEQRHWWLSDPLFLMSGNDRRTEHFVRLVAWEMWEHLEGVNINFRTAISRTSWPVMHSARIAHGWPHSWWGLDLPPNNREDLVGFRFAPTQQVVLDPTGSIRDDWALELQNRSVYGPEVSRRATAELRQLDWGDRYLPSYTIHEDLSDQTAFFARGDSFAVAAATDLRGHPLAIRRPLDVGIVFMRDELDEPTIAWGEEVSLARYLFRATIPAEAHLVSIEALSGLDAAARVRFGHGLPDRGEGALGLSDLLLFEWQEDLPEELDAVAPHMLGSTRLTGNDAVGLYWEMYGLEDAAGLEVSVTVQRQDAGFFRRLGQALRLVGERDGPSVRWEEGERDGEVAGRTLRLDLSGLEAGQYVLELEVRTQDGREAVATREFVRVGS